MRGWFFWMIPVNLLSGCNFMYGLMLAHLEQMPSFKYAKKQLCDMAALLEKKVTIPQIKEKLPLIREIGTDAFWEAKDLLLFEKVRKELRDLIHFWMKERKSTRSSQN